MSDRTTASQSQRIGVLAAVTLLHVALLIGILFARGTAPPAAAKLVVASLIAIDAGVLASRPPPPPRLPSKAIELPQLTAEAATFEPDSTSFATLAGQCATLDSVSKAIVAAPLAVAAIINAPPETRSIADAVVLWNAGWSGAADTPEARLGPARAVVESSLRTMEDGCLDEAISGPRLIPVPIADEQRTMFVVLGSGNWTWRQLIADTAATDASPDMTGERPWYDLIWP